MLNVILEKNKKIIKNMKTNSNIQKIEDFLSEDSQKTCNYEKYINYLTNRNTNHNELYKYYTNPLFRKLKWRTFTLTQKSESKLVNKIKDTYGDNVLLLYGNWSRNSQMKFSQPTPNIGIKRLLSNSFDIAMVDEYKTSKLCHYCKSENKNLIKRPVFHVRGKLAI